jgi:hypothetical protein
VRKAKKIAGLLFLATLAWAVIYIAGSIVSSFTTFTSFPWWSGFVFAAIYFGPWLLLEAAVYGLLTWRIRKVK